MELSSQLIQSPSIFTVQESPGVKDGDYWSELVWWDFRQVTLKGSFAKWGFWCQSATYLIEPHDLQPEKTLNRWVLFCGELIDECQLNAHMSRWKFLFQSKVLPLENHVTPARKEWFLGLHRTSFFNKYWLSTYCARHTGNNDQQEQTQAAFLMPTA